MPEAPPTTIGFPGDLKLSRFVVASPSLYRRQDREHRRVLFSTRAVQATVVSESVWTALQNGRHSLLSAEVASALIEGGVLVDHQEDELAAVLNENQAAITESRVLKHVIQPTAACQLGCEYCGQDHFSRQLSEDHQDALLKRLGRRLESGDYSSLDIGWFGAEPLLGIKTMRRLSPQLIEAAETRGAAYSSTIVTNGLRLNADMALELEDLHRVRSAEITLDGPNAVHDARRYVKNGNPSFARIFRNLVRLSQTPEITMGISIRCNVDRHNADHVSELIDLLRAERLHKRVSLNFASVYSWGNDAHADALEPDDFGAREIEWFAQMHNMGFDLNLLPGRRRIVCLAVRRDGELTDALGNIFNCTEVSYVPTYGEPNRFALGTLDTGVVADGAPFRTFNDEVASGKHRQCADCRMLPVCGGACPKQWSEGNVPCPPAKANISERLALWNAIGQT